MATIIGAISAFVASLFKKNSPVPVLLVSAEDHAQQVGEPKEVAPPEVIAVVKKPVSPEPTKEMETSVKTMFEIKTEMLIEEAKKWLFVREQGVNAGKEVEMFQKTINPKPVNEPWCLAFVQYCVREVDRKYAETYGHEAQPTLLKPTESCMYLWNNMPKESKTYQKLVPGMIIIWQHYSAEMKPLATGHTGIIVRVVDDTTVETIEGNTGPGVGVVRDGDGVYQKLRSLREMGRMRVKGCLKPWVDDSGVGTV